MCEFWSELADELGRWSNAMGTFEDAPEIEPGEVGRWLRSQIEDGDRACGAWIECGKWPELTPDLRWQIGLRLSFAVQLCLLLSISPMQHPARLPALEWLLLHCWGATGPERAQDLVGG